jgi:hypothetical protein
LKWSYRPGTHRHVTHAGIAASLAGDGREETIGVDAMQAAIDEGDALAVLMPSLIYYGGGSYQFGFRYFLDAMSFVLEVVASGAHAAEPLVEGADHGWHRHPTPGRPVQRLIAAFGSHRPRNAATYQRR